MQPLTLDLLAVSAGAPTDFDFIIGSWQVQHRRLKRRLCGCTDWERFSGLSSTRKLLGGLANLEDNLLDLPDDRYRAAALRSFDPASRQWSIWWLDGRRPQALDVPVLGCFRDGLGSFYADDWLDGRPIQLRFLWFPAAASGQPRWEQACSADGGRSWETNWTMDFSPAAPQAVPAG